jgi:hypothetical protein
MKPFICLLKLKIMRKLMLSAFLLGLFATSFVGCREKSATEKAADDIENAAEDVGDEIEDAVD